MFTHSFLSKKLSATFALSTIATALSYSSVSLAQNISGTIVDSQGNAVSGAHISIHGQRQSVDSDQQGNFTLSDLNAGKFELHTSADNYAHASQYIMVDKDDVSGVVIKLTSTVMEVLDIYATPLHSSSIESALPINVISGDDLKLKQAST
jgi:iron complex outermembrane receptor protein